MGTYQQCIARIRQVTDLPIIVAWGYTIGVDLAGPWTWAPSVKMNVLADDPRVQGTNIAYTWHWYEGNPMKNQAPMNDVASLTQYLDWTQISEVATRKCLICTELGGRSDDPSSITWMNNAIDLLYAKGIGIIHWVWSAPLMTVHGDEIIATAPNFQLTSVGVAFTQKTLQMPTGTPSAPPSTPGDGGAAPSVPAGGSWFFPSPVSSAVGQDIQTNLLVAALLVGVVWVAKGKKRKK